jgi:nicotinamidase-related amidase
MNKYALMVIDCQNYFFDRASPAYLKASPKILPGINRLIALARDMKWPVIYTVHQAQARPGNLMAERWEHLPTGRESRLHPGVAVVPGAPKIVKEHFSAFFATGLEEYLRRQGITDLVVCGVMTHLCVDTTVRHGFMLGFRSIVISDACCSKNREYHQAALLALRHGFCRTMTVGRIVKAAADENI